MSGCWWNISWRRRRPTRETYPQGGLEWYARLEAYAWPGNVRELRNAVEAAVVTSLGNVLRTEDLWLIGSPSPTASGGWSIPAGMTFDQIEKDHRGRLALEQLQPEPDGGTTRAFAPH